MLCARCSHTLPPRADRCVRCFALNPRNLPAPAPRAPHDSGPAGPVQLSISSQTPAAPLAITFDDDPKTAAPRERGPAASHQRKAPALHKRAAGSPLTRKLPPLPRLEPDALFAQEPDAPPPRQPPLPFVCEPAAPTPAPAPHRRAPPRVSAGARLLAWSLDGALVGGATAASIAGSLRVAHVRYPFDFLRDAAPLFCALFCCAAVAYAAFLTALCGRTAGMALAGHRLHALDGTPLTPRAALLRAVLSLPSAALGFFGFALALFDRRGQTLHDKLCRCVAVVD